MRERMQMGAKRQHAASERNQAEQEDEAAGQPHAALPPHRPEHAADAGAVGNSDNGNRPSPPLVTRTRFLAGFHPLSTGCSSSE